MTDSKAGTQSPSVHPVALAAEPPPTVDFRTVYESHFDYVFHSLRRLGAPERDLEDLIHEVFLAFYRSGYDPARPLKPWLFGIAFRVASDWRRRAQHRYEVPTEPRDMASPAPRADEQVEARERRALVLAALQAIELSRRAVFVMHDIDGLSMPEIAAVLEAPLNTLYSRLRLARAEFADAVKREKAKMK
jgi:RNA polymerase sigma-70 factor (ECF subfamily)